MYLVTISKDGQVVGKPFQLVKPDVARPYREVDVQQCYAEEGELTLLFTQYGGKGIYCGSAADAGVVVESPHTADASAVIVEIEGGKTKWARELSMSGTPAKAPGASFREAVYMLAKGHGIEKKIYLALREREVVLKSGAYAFEAKQKFEDYFRSVHLAFGPEGSSLVVMDSECNFGESVAVPGLLSTLNVNWNTIYLGGVFSESLGWNGKTLLDPSRADFSGRVRPGMNGYLISLQADNYYPQQAWAMLGRYTHPTSIAFGPTHVFMVYGQKSLPNETSQFGAIGRSDVMGKGKLVTYNDRDVFPVYSLRQATEYKYFMTGFRRTEMEPFGNTAAYGYAGADAVARPAFAVSNDSLLVALYSGGACKANIRYGLSFVDKAKRATRSGYENMFGVLDLATYYVQDTHMYDRIPSTKGRINMYITSKRLREELANWQPSGLPEDDYIKTFDGKKWYWSDHNWLYTEYFNMLYEGERFTIRMEGRWNARIKPWELLENGFRILRVRQASRYMWYFECVARAGEFNAGNGQMGVEYRRQIENFTVTFNYNLPTGARMRGKHKETFKVARGVTQKNYNGTAPTTHNCLREFKPQVEARYADVLAPNYVLVGWYTEKPTKRDSQGNYIWDDSARLNWEREVDKSETYYARWELRKFPFVTNCQQEVMVDGFFVSQIPGYSETKPLFYYGQEIGITVKPRPGKDFKIEKTDGVEEVPDKLHTYSVNGGTASRVEINLVWGFNVVVRPNNGEKPRVQFVKDGDAIPSGLFDTPTSPAVGPTHFIGWFAEDGTEVDVTNPGLRENTVVTARWGYAVHFEGLETPPAKDLVVEAGELVQEPTGKLKVPVGMTPVGWVDQHGKDWDFRASRVDEDVTLSPKWEALPVQVSFKVKADATVSKTLNKKFGETISPADAPPLPSIAGMSFDYWYKEGDASKSAYVWATPLPLKSFTLVGKWSRVRHKVTFNLSGAPASVITSKNPVSVFYGEKVSAPTIDPSQYLHHVLKGWYYLEGGVKKPWDFTTDEVKQDLELIAEWEKTFPITYVLGTGASWPASFTPVEEVENTKTLPEPATPTRPRFVFKEWYLDAAYTQVARFPLAITAPVTLYAKWDGEKEYTVTVEQCDENKTPTTEGVVTVTAKTTLKADGNTPELANKEKFTIIATRAHYTKKVVVTGAKGN